MQLHQSLSKQLYQNLNKQLHLILNLVQAEIATMINLMQKIVKVHKMKRI